MTSSTINVGTLPNDGTGAKLRLAFSIVNQNFTAIDALITALQSAVPVALNVDVNGVLTATYGDGDTQVLGNLKGPKGDTGTPGTVFRTGSGVPANSLGIDGDLYLNTNTASGQGDLYQRASGAYALAGNLRGPIGVTGTPGTVFRTGSGVPSNTLGIDGDLYLNLNATSGTGDLYLRSGGTYSLTGNLRGPAGTGNVSTSGTATNGQLALFSGGTTIGGVTAVPASNFPALTGDVTTAAGSLVTAIAAGVVTYAKLATAAISAAADIFANAASKIVSVASLWSSQVFVTLTDAATITVDMSTFLNAKVTLGGNRTLGTPANAKEGQSGIIQIIQDSTGSRTLSYASGWDFGSAGTPTLSTAAGKIDTISYVVISTTGPVVRAYFGKSA